MNARVLKEEYPPILERSASVKIGGRSYEMILNTSATMAISKKFGSLKNLGEAISENPEEGFESVIWLLALLCNQSVAIHNFLHPDSPEELLTEEYISLITTPNELSDYKDAIMTAIQKGVHRDVKSEEQNAKNTQAG